MSPSPPGRRAIWLLPIVVALGALMLLPAGAGLGSALTAPSSHASPAATAASTFDARTTTSSRASSSPTVPSNPLSPSDIASEIATARAGGSSSRPTEADFSQALSELASNPSLSSHASLLHNLAKEVGSGQVSPNSIYLPNLALLANSVSSPSQVVSPGYDAQPAPMGLGDFGLGASGAYEYNSSSFAGTVVMNESQATYPGAYYFVTGPDNVNAAYQDPYRYGIQLNTVETNVSIPGTEKGMFWTQNVVTWDNYTDTLQFEDNVWNFTSPTITLNAGTIYSGGGTQVIPTFYYDYGPNYALTPPFTLNLYNNATVIGDRSATTFGYALRDSDGHFYSGVYDTVIFASPGANLTVPVAPTYAPQFQVNGFTTTPSELLLDSELIVGGPGGGSNAVFSYFNGSMTLNYLKGASYTGIPSAYDFGGDTGETAVGIAGWWTGTTEFLNQGPSLLYGLWGAQANTAVAAGDIHLAGYVDPSYAFLFVGNTATNLSFVPTYINGVFNTYLPATVPPATCLDYCVASYADGFANYAATFTGNTYLTVGMTAKPGFNNAPLYMNGLVQQGEAEANVGNLFGEFINLQLDVNITFNHLNDWGYQSFDLISATGTEDLVISNVTQGPDVGTQTIYVYDNPGRAATLGLLTPAPIETHSLPGYSGTIALLDDDGSYVWNETFIGYNSTTVLTSFPFPDTPAELGGGALFMWDSGFETAWNITAVGGSLGVYLSDCGFVEVYNVTASGGSNGITVWDSEILYFYNIYASGQYTYGIFLAFSEGASIYHVNASADAWGVVLSPTIYVFTEFVNATSGAVGVYATYGTDGVNPPVAGGANTVEYANANDGATAVASFYETGDTYDFVTAQGTGMGVYIADGLGLDVNFLTVGDSGTSTGSVIQYSDLVTFDVTNITGGAAGVSSFADNNTTYLGTSVDGGAIGVSESGSANSTFTYLWDNAATSEAVSLTGDYLAEVQYLTVNATGTLGVLLTDDSHFTGEYATTAGPTTFKVVGGTEIDLEDGTTALVSGTSASGTDQYGIGLNHFSQSTISGASATDATATAVALDYAAWVTVSGTTATNDAEGVWMEWSTWITVSGTTVSGLSLGVLVGYDSSYVTVSTTTVTNESIGVEVYEAGLVGISGITASNTTLASPWNSIKFWGFPASAVVTYYTYQVTVSNVTATNYPILLYDYDSGSGDYGAGSLYVTDVNATGGWYALMLNYTEYGYFTGVGAFQDFQGVSVFDGYQNDILGSSFVDDTSYGVSLWYGSNNYVWGNNFIGDNGATSTYSAAHIQAYSGYGYGPNYFDSPVAPYEGNYWADWHTYSSNGELAPYYVGDQTWDYYPLQLNAGVSEVWFYATGLQPGTTWSVTFNGVMQSTANDWLVFGVPNGNYAFTVGAVAGYKATPTSGTVAVTSPYSYVDLTYSQLYNVTVTETGLAQGTSWSAIFAGQTVHSNTTSITFTAPAGTFAYQIPTVAGYTASPSSGSVTVTSGAYNISVAFTQVKYTVTITESGLASGTSWSATIGGNQQTSTGTAITFSLPNGTYTVTVANVSGYTLSSGSFPLTVSGAATGASVTFTPISTTSVVSTSTFDTWLAVAIAIAVIALVIGLLAVFLRRRREPPAQTGAQPWTPPASESTTTTPTTPPASGGSASSWSEGAPPPAGETPPPSS